MEKVLVFIQEHTTFPWIGSNDLWDLRFHFKAINALLLFRFTSMCRWRNTCRISPSIFRASAIPCDGEETDSTLDAATWIFTFSAILATASRNSIKLIWKILSESSSSTCVIIDKLKEMLHSLSMKEGMSNSLAMLQISFNSSRHMKFLCPGRTFFKENNL